jgi:hypothetical protein
MAHVGNCRVRRAITALTLLLSILVTTVTSVAHTSGDRDADCAAIILHDASAHIFTSPDAPDSAPLLHCLACHWARSFRPAPDATTVAALIIVPTPPRCDEADAVCQAAMASQPPLRSPPL